MEYDYYFKNDRCLFVVAFEICVIKKISDNFNAWNYERNHKEYLKLREECRREKEKNG
jgi:hypothetical protein